MATFSKSKLSASVDGRAIKVAATATPGTVLHTASTTPATLHEVWLYATNTDGAARKLTVEWGATTSPDDLIELTIPLEGGLVLVSPGLLLVGNATPLVVRAFAEATNLITIHGYVNVIA
jgi:hypothetical protein